MPIYIQNKTKEKEKNFLCRKPGPLINKTKKRKPIPSLSELSPPLPFLKTLCFHPDLHTFTVHAIRVSTNLSRTWIFAKLI